MTGHRDLVVYTLVEGDYVAGLAALVNSLRANGFSGEIRVGATDSGAKWDAFGPAIRLEALRTSERWIGNRRAELILEHPANRFLFLDADVIVRDPALFERMTAWLERGPVFAVEALLPPADFRRLAWRDRLGVASTPRPDTLSYFNSGLFAGVLDRDRALLVNWDDQLRRVLRPPGRLFEDADFPMPDQDVLNALLQDHTGPIVAISPPDVWYAASPVQPFLHVGGFQEPVIAHCTGREKPWRLSRVPPRAPNLYERDWYRYVFQQPTPIKLDLKMPGTLHSWFRHRPLGRAIQRFGRWGERLRPRS